MRIERGIAKGVRPRGGAVAPPLAAGDAESLERRDTDHIDDTHTGELWLRDNQGLHCPTSEVQGRARAISSLPMLSGSRKSDLVRRRIPSTQSSMKVKLHNAGRNSKNKRG